MLPLVYVCSNTYNLDGEIMRVLDMELELEALREFKEWCIDNVKGFTTKECWEVCDMKKKLDELGLDDCSSDKKGLN